jgi:hypothetical protein
MSETKDAPTAMSRPAEDHLVDYESFNIFALAGLLLGLASAASLIDHLFWLIPAAGTLLSLYALWMFSHSDRKQVGRPLAVVGLCLSVFFLVAAPAAAVVEHIYVRAESRAFADRWLDYLQKGDRVAAYDMTLNYPSRAFRDDLSDRTKHENEEPMWIYYDQTPWVKDLVEAHDNAKWEYVETPVQTFANGRYLVHHRYDIRLSKQSVAEPFDLVLEREKDHSTGKWHWRIARLTHSGAAQK